jgi:signal transduction histidine kinase
MDAAAALDARDRGDGRVSESGPVRTGYSPARLLLASFLLAVAAFIAATAATAARLREVSIQSEDIYANAMPSVMALSSLRERLHDLVVELNLAVESHSTTVPGLDRTLADIGAQSDAYERHSPSGEGGPWRAAREAVSRAMADAGRVRDHLAAGDPAGARSLLDSVRVDLGRAHTETWRLVEMNASQGLQSARHIERVRRSATLLSFVLDALCVALAGGLALIAFRSVREHAMIVERRSLELEQFAARVAHDLRGPLSPVLVALQILRKDIASRVEREKILDRAVRSVGRLTVLVDDLLAFAMAGGRADLSARANALDVARATVEDVQPMAEERSVSVQIDPGAADVTVACPGGVLTSLLSNLVGNAIKYMDHTGVRRVIVRVVANAGRARVEVEDTGPGLPPDALQGIFEPYVRADRTGQPGLGLGLAIVKRLAEAYGGAVGVRSSGSGSTFWFELCLAEERGGSPRLT